MTWKLIGAALVAAALTGQAQAAVLYATPPASTGLSAYTSTITINPDGSITTVGGGPNFGGEDSLVRVVNLSPTTVSGLSLSGTNIFGFDGDGTLGGSDPLDYTGALVTFTVATANTGTVNFTGGLATNSDLFFELEEDVGLAGSGFTAGPPGTAVPEPASLLLVGMAVSGMAWMRRRRV